MYSRCIQPRRQPSDPTFSCRPTMQVNSAGHTGHDTHRFSSIGSTRHRYQSATPLPATPWPSLAARPSFSPALRPTARNFSKPVFCCSSYRPYRSTHTDEEDKFDTFLGWTQGGGSSYRDGQNYVIQAVKQVNFGPVEEVRYFLRTPDGFEEVTEAFVRLCGLAKKNNYKNFKCQVHNKFFEVNLYQENAFSKRTTKYGKASKSNCLSLWMAKMWQKWQSQCHTSMQPEQSGYFNI